MAENKHTHCSFCGRSDDEVDQLYTADGRVFICDRCIEECHARLSGNKSAKPVSVTVSVPTPKEIKQKLDEYIIGQEQAKKVLSVAVYNHYKRIGCSGSDVEMEKSNVLLLGPTGCGKTMLASTMAKILDVPFVVVDATSLTEAGYVGEDVENILLKLIQKADYDIEKAQVGIIYIDEVDKLAKKGENMSITRDVSGEGVQQALLKILESTVASVPPQGGRKHPQQECIQIDTTNILFICGGAFVGLDKIVAKRKQGSALGFGADVKGATSQSYGEICSDIKPDDLIKFGLIPEFVGRVPVVVSVDSLDEKALINILVKPKNALVKQYKALFARDGVDVEFTDEALHEIASQAVKMKTGARGLKSIVENIMLDVMFDAPGDKTIQKIVITKDCAELKEKPTVIRKSA